MSIVKVKCKSCEATLAVDKSDVPVFCPYCSAPFEAVCDNGQVVYNSVITSDKKIARLSSAKCLCCDAQLINNNLLKIGICPYCGMPYDYKEEDYRNSNNLVLSLANKQLDFASVDDFINKMINHKICYYSDSNPMISIFFKKNKTGIFGRKTAPKYIPLLVSSFANGINLERDFKSYDVETRTMRFGDDCAIVFWGTNGKGYDILFIVKDNKGKTALTSLDGPIAQKYI